MKLLRHEHLPSGYNRMTPEAFTEYDEERLRESGADLVAYWYGSGSYEGTGHIIARKAGRWYQHDCSHCSCYGPTCHIDFNGSGDESLDSLLASCSQELRGYLEPLAALLQANL